MLQMKQLSIYEQIIHLKEQLPAEADSVSVSLVEHIQPVSAVCFFQKAADYAGSRFFWQSAEGDLTLAGAGAFATLEAASGAGRFQDAQSKIASYKQNMRWTEEAEHRGTGPLFFGGFSFFPGENQTPWEEVPEALFILPEILLTQANGQYFITYHVNIDQQTDPEKVVERLECQKENLLHGEKQEAPWFGPLELHDRLSYTDWKTFIEQAVQDITDGPLNKVVLARQLKAIFTQPVAVERLLEELYARRSNDYVFLLEYGETVFAGATPERLVQVEGSRVRSACIAGSIGRGATTLEDEAKAEALLNDEKNREEHQYVVDMIQDALAPLCEKVKLPESPEIMRLKTIQHLYTPVHGKALAEAHIFDYIERLHPTPAMGGVPQKEALTYIEENEPLERGWYAAPIGWVDGSGGGDFAAAIRSMLIQERTAVLFAGCGIVADSTPLEEYEETNLKFQPMLQVLGGRMK
ncbi:isochorismate synthase [Salsuginibacillus halophilus]|uniref:isochorismate synthase n=1 Tax=Salsuginibacillus halophilus TaxID=517424 RepID=A0A2P8HWB7_9BACI|nr:isochorismate synthase [Salsuginibacillus halophilus]PSL50517.1 isochorismate synthase [Salsuginibacillus halophilus]